MRAEVIAIGDELTSGVRLDTNSQWLSQQLEETGVRVGYHTTVGDDMDAIVLATRSALARANVVILSGGLGPTADDLTRQALAEAVDRPLAVDPAVLQYIRDLFARRGRVMPERNVVQAEFPEGSSVIANPQGTAPGIHLEVSGDAGTETTHVFALPGVPAEMRQMWAESVEPILLGLLGSQRRVICHRIIRCFGAGESDIEQQLPDLVRRGRKPSVGITASQATISLRITAEGKSVEACQSAMDPTIATIKECLGTLVFGEGDDTLHDVIGRLLKQRHLRLATAEWGTQGLLASWLGTIKNNRIYGGGIVIGDNDMLEAGLGISLGDDNSPDVTDLVAEMACQVRKRLQADLGLAVGPRPRGAGDRPGRIFFALATPDELLRSSSVFAAHPAIQRQLAAKQALNLTRLWLLRSVG